MKIDRIIAYAAQISDIDVGVRAIQDELGISSGDLAGQFFCGGDADRWGDMTFEERVASLREYVATEFSYWRQDETLPDEPRPDDPNRPHEIAAAAALEHGWPVPNEGAVQPQIGGTVNGEVLRRSVMKALSDTLGGDMRGPYAAVRHAVNDAFASLGLGWPRPRMAADPSRPRGALRVTM